MGAKEKIKKFLASRFLCRATTREIYVDCFGKEFDPFALLKEMRRSGDLDVKANGAHFIWELKA